MKRIFLTSGLVLCMACPAFAANVTGNGNECVENILGASENGADVQLRATWTGNYDPMTLNENEGNTTATGGATPTDELPDDLFLVGGEGVYRRSGTSDDNYVFTKLTAGEAALGATPIIPTGITVNFSFNANASTVGHANTDVSGMPTPTDQNAATRTFLGYYANGTDAAIATATPANGQYITADGLLTAAGETAAATYSNSTPWQAVYSVVHPTSGDSAVPRLTGYSFKGWSTTSDGLVISKFADYKIGQDTTLYAIWGTNSTKVIYNCGAGINGSTGSFIADSPLANATYDNTAHAQQATYDSQYSHPTIEGNCEMTGYTPGDWVCVSGTSSSVDTANQLTSNGIANGMWHEDLATVTCTATWTQNKIDLFWDANQATEFASNGGASCDYDGNVSLPTAPQRTGYEFGGWEVVPTPQTPTTTPVTPTPAP